MKKSIAIALALLLAFAAVVPTAAATPFYIPYRSDQAHYAMDEQIFPIWDMFESIGAEVHWEDTYGAIVIFWQEHVIVLFPLERYAVVDESLVLLHDGVLIYEDMFVLTFRDLVAIESALIPTGFEYLTFHLTPEARAFALFDFDYLIALIYENTPWAGVIYRVLGFDFLEFAGLYRQFIYNMNPFTIRMFDEELFLSVFPFRFGDTPRDLAANYLMALLMFDFAPNLGGIGHLGPRSADFHRIQKSALLQQQYENPDVDNHLLDFILHSFNHPSVRWLYGPIDFEYEDTPFPIVPDNIETLSIAPGEIAYLRIRSFMSEPAHDDEYILPFLLAVQDYDHLIIDLRGNLGGWALYFDELIFRRLINEPTYRTGHEFISGGRVAAQYMEIAYRTVQEIDPVVYWMESVSHSYARAADFVAERGMRYFDPVDLARLDYVMLSTSRTLPDGDVRFNGKVWLLADGMSASASAAAASTARYTGFATVVGDNTSGVMGASHLYRALPITGILWRLDIGYHTDEYGRSLEVYGIAPDIRNFPGMDALETVLAIIAQG